MAKIDFEQELYKAFGQIKDFTLGVRIAKYFYDMGTKAEKEEPVSEDLEEAATSYAATGEILDNRKEMIYFQKKLSFKAGAQWKEEKYEGLKKLADAMYYAAQYLTTDASRLRKAMDEYHQFIITQNKE